ncbi:MAG: hypothetical protein HRU28_09040 [Rhizobiales bacterium]|nr:hypothetical protein [Hyphomicrobiales bacterium]
MQTSIQYLAKMLVKTGGVFVIDQSIDGIFLSSIYDNSVHIKANYNESKLVSKIFITPSNITAKLKLDYANIVEILRIKIRTIIK